MGQTAKVTRKNRTITVDFHNEATYDQLLDDTKAFVEFVLAFLLALGFQLLHKGIVKLMKKSLPDAFPLRKAEGVGIAKIQGLVKSQNPL